MFSHHRTTPVSRAQTALALTVVVAIAHSTYVGSAGCMPPAVALAAAQHNVSTAARDIVYEIAVVASDTDPSVVARYSLVSVPALAFLPDTLLRAHDFPVYVALAGTLRRGRRGAWFQADAPTCCCVRLLPCGQRQHHCSTDV